MSPICSSKITLTALTCFMSNLSLCLCSALELDLLICSSSVKLPVQIRPVHGLSVESFSSYLDLVSSSSFYQNSTSLSSAVLWAFCSTTSPLIMTTGLNLNLIFQKYLLGFTWTRNSSVCKTYLVLPWQSWNHTPIWLQTYSRHNTDISCKLEQIYILPCSEKSNRRLEEKKYIFQVWVQKTISDFQNLFSKHCH